jgi:predicted acylesterase/phospholipase RssA
MSKKLKVGFAMGGGVSLGTFSGAALSEAIKQLILYGGYTENGVFTRYKNIEIDVFSGASAGMMSLAIMLRGLSDHSNDERDKATAQLEKEFGATFIKNLHDNDNARYQQLIVAQVVQNLQESIWVEQINIDTLLGFFKEKTQDLSYEPGILAREALLKIARENFQLGTSGQTLFSRRQILASRVLVAASLANLTSIKYDARSKDDPSYIALGDAKTSYEHRELRVFDLNFETLAPDTIESNPNDYPHKWVRYHMGAKAHNYFGDIREKNAWAKIVATGIACGSFPFAFEPSVVTRHDFEYGVRRKEGVITDNGDWPEKLKGKDCYPFTYIDGGTFNNEPIREAYRLASFQDAGETEEFDRVIIFVDPSVAGGDVNFRVPIHKEYYLRGRPVMLPDIRGYEVLRSTTADRLIGHAGTLVSAILNQARINEGDKIHRVIEQFHDSEEYRNFFLQLVEIDNVSDAYILNLRNFCRKMLGEIQINELLPPGAVTVPEELIRINRYIKGALTVADINHLMKGEFDQINASGKQTLTKTMIFLLIDLMIGVGGKVKDSKTIAIAPVKPRGNDFAPVFLPGGYFEAFAGFTSTTPNTYEIELAKYCAQVYLKKAGLIGGVIAKQFTYRDFTPKEQKQFEEDFKSKLPIIEARISEILHDTEVLNVGGLIDKFVMNKISKKVNEALEAFKFINKSTTTYLLRIPVEKMNYQIASDTNGGDISPIEVAGKNGVTQHYLMIELDFVTVDGENGKWEDTGHVHNGRLLIEKNILGWKKLDRAWSNVQLPSAELLRDADLWPNPILELENTIGDDSHNKLYNKWTVPNSGVVPLEELLLQ